MRPADLNLLRSRPNTPWLAWLLLALGASLCLLVGFHYRQVDAAMAQTQLSAAKHRPMARPQPNTQPQVGQDQTTRPPWDALLTRLEYIQRNDIALLSLDAHAYTTAQANTQGQATLTAEAADAAAMLAYLQQLRAQPGFAPATLLNHSTQASQPGSPLRFSIRLPWGAP